MTQKFHLRQFAILLGAAALLIIPARAHAFSVLAHQAVVDQAWQGTILPAVRKRFPNASAQDLADARAYALKRKPEIQRAFNGASWRPSLDSNQDMKAIAPPPASPFRHRAVR